MKVAILGTGGIGCGYAAFLAAAGHAPVLWSPTGTGLTAPGCDLVSTGVIAATQKVSVAASCVEAVTGADAVLVAVIGNGLRGTLEALAPTLRGGQIVVISGHLSFAGLYLSQLLSARGIDAAIAAWATTALTARRGPGTSVHISGRRPRLDVAALQPRHAAASLAICQALFGDHFDLQPNLLSITLSNLNPPSHLANMLCNLTRAEKGEIWANYGGITPAVARLMEALDRERLSVAEAFGLRVRSIEDHFVASFPVTRAPLAEMAAAVFARRPELAGPTTLDTRFITEDVPFGLVPMAELGRIAGVAMPLHDGGIALISALYGRHFAAENDLLPKLGVAGWDRERLLAQFRDAPRQQGAA